MDRRARSGVVHEVCSAAIDDGRVEHLPAFPRLCGSHVDQMDRPQQQEAMYPPHMRRVKRNAVCVSLCREHRLSVSPQRPRHMPMFSMVPRPREAGACLFYYLAEL